MVNENTAHEMDLVNLQNFLHETLGVNIQALMANEETDDFKRQLNVRNEILRALLKTFKQGNHPEDFRLADDFDIDSYVDGLKEETGKTTCNIMFTGSQVEIIKKAEGNDIKAIFDNLQKFAENATTLCDAYKSKKVTEDTFVNDLARMMIGRGIEALDAGVVKEVVDSVVKGASAVKAAVVGIKTMNPIMVMKAVADILAVFWSLFDSSRTLAGLVINETRHDLVVKNWKLGLDGKNTKGWEKSDLYMRHGKMLEYMNDATGKSPVQVAKIPGCEHMAYGGIFEMSSRTAAAGIGVNAVMRFTIDKDTLDFYCCCPRRNDNGVDLKLNSRVTPEKSADDSDKTYTTSSLVSNNNIRAEARINHHRGGRAYAICVIEPAK